VNDEFSFVGTGINNTFSYIYNLYPPNFTIEPVHINFNLRLFPTKERKEENQHFISFYSINSTLIS